MAASENGNPIGKLPYDAYLKISDHPGESTDSVHEEWVDVKQFRHDLDQKISGSFAGSGAPTAGEATHGFFWVCKEIDKTSPKLRITMLQGKVIDELILEVCTQSGEKQTYYKVTMENCVVGSMHTLAAPLPPEIEALPVSKPVEWVGFAYGKITFNYTEMDPQTGANKGTIESHWDRKNNTGG